MQAAGIAPRSRFLPGNAAIGRISSAPASIAMKISAKKKISLESMGIAGDFAAAARNGSCREADRPGNKVGIVWFKRDLRMDDHPGLVAAASSGFDAVIPLFVFDPLLFRGWSQALVEALLEAVVDLRLALQDAGSDLVVRIGSVEEVLQGIVNQVNASDVYTEDEVEDEMAQIVSSTLGKFRHRAVLRKWTSSLHELPDLPMIPDDYSKFNAMKYPISPSLEAPSSLPPLPRGLTKGKIPLAREFLLMINHAKQTVLEEENTEFFLRSQKPMRLSRRPPVWLRKLLAWLPKTAVKKPLCIEDELSVGCGARDALRALRLFVRVPGDHWRMEQHLRKRKAVSFRKAFDKALALGTISLRRTYHEALLYSKNKWISSQAVTAVVEEVKLIEWYNLLHRKTQLQEAHSGWRVKAWKWRGFLVQYTTCGEDGPAVVLVHGFGAFWQHYRNNIRELASEGNRVWAISMLGFGRSEKPGIVYTEILWAELLRDFITDVVGEPAVLVGNSLGGYIATMVAGLWPPLVNSLVLLNTAGIVDPGYHTVDDLRNARRNGVPRASLQVLLFFLQQQCASAFKLCYPSHSERVDEWIIGEALRASFDPGATSVLESMFYLRLPLPLNFLLKQYDGNTLIVQGIFDPLQNSFKKAQALQACCKDVTVAIVNAGHCPHDEVPKEVNRIISGWVKETSAKLMDWRVSAGTSA